METKWFKLNLPWAIGNSVVDHVSIAKQKISEWRKGNEIKAGIVYDDSIDFQEDLIRFNPHLDDIKTTEQHKETKEKLHDPTEGLSWNYLVKNDEIARFTPSKEQMDVSRNYLLQNGINPYKDKIISFHVREPGYKHYPTADRHPHRFVGIETFMRLAEHYISRGYKVIRLGDPSSTPFPTYLNFLDTSRIEDKRLIHDICFIKFSNAFIGTDSGMWLPSVAMGTPTLLSNNCHGRPGIGMKRWWFPWEEGHAVLHKNPFKNGKLISSENTAAIFDGMSWTNTRGVTLKDNTFEQIKTSFDLLLKGNEK